MKKPRMRHPHQRPPTQFPGYACEICGAPYKLIQALDLPTENGAPPYGSYVPTCKCERPAAPKRDYSPDVPF